MQATSQGSGQVRHDADGYLISTVPWRCGQRWFLTS